MVNMKKFAEHINVMVTLNVYSEDSQKHWQIMTNTFPGLNLLGLKMYGWGRFGMEKTWANLSALGF